MANPYRAEVEVELGGTKQMLIYDHNALCELEEMYEGKSISAIFGFGNAKRAAESIGFSLIRKALYVGLRKRNKGLTLDKVGDMMAPGQLGEYMQAITKGLLGAMFGPNGPTPTDEAQAEQAIAEYEENPK